MKNLNLITTTAAKKIVFFFIVVCGFSITEARGSDYNYKSITIEAEWESCEPSRDLAIKWAGVALLNKAHSECGELGRDWNFSAINFEGYQEIEPCKDGKSFKAYIKRAIASCKSLRKK